jgi:hypothetical protein
MMLWKFALCSGRALSTRLGAGKSRFCSGGSIEVASTAASASSICIRRACFATSVLGRGGDLPVGLYSSQQMPASAFGWNAAHVFDIARDSRRADQRQGQPTTGELASGANTSRSGPYVHSRSRSDPFAAASAHDRYLRTEDGGYRRKAAIADRVRGRRNSADKRPYRGRLGKARSPGESRRSIARAK